MQGFENELIARLLPFGRTSGGIRSNLLFREKLRQRSYFPDDDRSQPPQVTSIVLNHNEVRCSPGDRRLPSDEEMRSALIHIRITHEHPQLSDRIRRPFQIQMQKRTHIKIGDVREDSFITTQRIPTFPTKPISSSPPCPSPLPLMSPRIGG